MTYTILNMADSIEDPTDKWPQSEPDARDFGDILAAGLNLTGVVSGCAVTAQGTPDMTVAVASGTVIVGGTSTAVTSGNVTVAAADVSPRFDLICVASNGTKSCVAGTGSSNPVFPDPAGKAVLAAIYVPASDTDIDSNQIVDKRVIIKPWLQLAGGILSGNFYVAPDGSAAITDVQGNTFNATSFISCWGDVSAASPLPSLTLRRFRGTIAAPLRTQSSDLMGRIGGTGAHAASDVAAGTLLTAAKAYIDFRASEAFTSTAQGSRISFSTTPAASTTAAEKMRLHDYGELMLDDIQAYGARKYAKVSGIYDSVNQASSGRGWSGGYFKAQLAGCSSSLAGNGVYVDAVDKSTVKAGDVTGAANNGGGLIRITATAHGLANGDRVGIGSVGGVTNANGFWVVEGVAANTFDLTGSTFAGVYTSGGKFSSAGVLTGVFASVAPIVARNLSGVTGSATNCNDVAAIVAWNGGTAAGVDAFYLGRNSPNFPASDEWYSGMTIAARCTVGLQFGSSSTLGTGIHFNGTITGSAIKFGAGHNIETNATTGTKIGTATTEKVAFHGSTAVIQKASAAQAAVATTGAVNTTPYGYTTAAQADAIVTLVNELRAALVEKGLIKGAA